ncbi:hypothetical protein SGPA1_10250 [Streptomyces misionensis JCM 4497]
MPGRPVCGGVPPRGGRRQRSGPDGDLPGPARSFRPLLIGLFRSFSTRPGCIRPGHRSFVRALIPERDAPRVTLSTAHRT